MNSKKGISVSMKPAIVNPDGVMDAETVATLLGVSTRQLNNYINLKDLPSQGSGKRRVFVWAEVREWYVGYRLQLENGYGNDGSVSGDFDDATSDSGPNENIRAANLRKTRAEANLKELQLAKLRSQVISIPDAKIRLDRLMGNLRAKLLGIAPKLVNRITTERDAPARQAIIQDEMESLCREVATGAVIDDSSDETRDGVPDEEILDDLHASAEAPALCLRCGREDGPSLIVGDDCTGWLCGPCYAELQEHD